MGILHSIKSDTFLFRLEDYLRHLRWRVMTYLCSYILSLEVAGVARFGVLHLQRYRLKPAIFLQLLELCELGKQGLFAAAEVHNYLIISGKRLDAYNLTRAECGVFNPLTHRVGTRPHRCR